MDLDRLRTMALDLLDHCGFVAPAALLRSARLRLAAGVNGYVDYDPPTRTFVLAAEAADGTHNLPLVLLLIQAAKQSHAERARSFALISNARFHEAAFLLREIHRAANDTVLECLDELLEPASIYYNKEHERELGRLRDIVLKVSIHPPAIVLRATPGRTLAQTVMEIVTRMVADNRKQEAVAFLQAFSRERSAEKVNQGWIPVPLDFMPQPHVSTRHVS